MTDIAAAIGLVQLGKLEKMNLRRRMNAVRLSRALADYRVDLPVEPAGITTCITNTRCGTRTGTRWPRAA